MPCVFFGQSSPRVIYKRMERLSLSYFSLGLPRVFLRPPLTMSRLRCLLPSAACLPFASFKRDCLRSSFALWCFVSVDLPLRATSTDPLEYFVSRVIIPTFSLRVMEGSLSSPWENAFRLVVPLLPTLWLMLPYLSFPSSSNSRLPQNRHTCEMSNGEWWHGFGYRML